MAINAQASGGHIATADTALYFGPYVFGTPTITGGAPAGGNYVDVYGSSRIFSQTLTSTNKTFLWFAQRFGWVTQGYPPYWTFFDEAGIAQCSLVMDTAGKMTFYLRTYSIDWSYGMAAHYTVIASTASIGPAASWYSLEGEITIHDTTGAFKLWVNGVLLLNLSNIDTKNAYASAYVYGLANAQGYFADLAIGDNASPNAARIGESRVDCMLPNANGTDRASGGATEMTRSTGADDYTLLDETAASAGTSDYVYSDAVGERCSVNVAALTNAGGTIVGVQATAYATKNEAGPCGFKLYCLRGGTRYYSGEFFPSFGSWGFFRYVWDQDPSTSAAWTESNFNAAEFGVERTT